MPKKSKEGYKYILVVIDLYTRYGWAIPMKDKKQETLAESFEFYFKKDNISGLIGKQVSLLNILKSSQLIIRSTYTILTMRVNQCLLKDLSLP